jgi:hypothetical protein
MADAVSKAVASAAEYNRVTANIRDLDSRSTATDATVTAVSARVKTLEDSNPVAAAPGVSLRIASNKTIAAAATYTVPFDSALFNTDSMWSSATPTTITVKTAGRYSITCNATTDGLSGTSIADGQDRFLLLLVNGTQIAVGGGKVPGSGHGWTTNVPAQVQLAVGDVVTVQIQNLSSTTATMFGTGIGVRLQMSRTSA